MQDSYLAQLEPIDYVGVVDADELPEVFWQVAGIHRYGAGLSSNPVAAPNQSGDSELLAMPHEQLLVLPLQYGGGAEGS